MIRISVKVDSTHACGLKFRSNLLVLKYLTLVTKISHLMQQATTHRQTYLTDLLQVADGLSFLDRLFL
jgi:hypothetical protein